MPIVGRQHGFSTVSRSAERESGRGGEGSQRMRIWVCACVSLVALLPVLLAWTVIELPLMSRPLNGRMRSLAGCPSVAS